MKKIMTATLMGLAVLSLAACKGEQAKAKDAGAKVEKAAKEAGADVKKAADNLGAKVTSYTKADFMKACETSLTSAQCDCMVDFYDKIGLKVTDLGDQDKVTAAVSNLKPEQAMEMAKCMQ